MIGEIAMSKRDRASFKGKKALVVGLARSGVAAANLLVELACQVRGTDLKGAEALGDALGRLDKKVALEIGGHDEASFVWADLIVLSPGVPIDLPQVAVAKKLGKEIISEIELAYSLLDAPFVAVTGTNGKTTTVSLLAAMLERAGYRVILGGNIGKPLCLFASEPLDADYVVAEISSFQLEAIKSFRPHVGAILNITPDHLDRHPGFQEYVELKKRIALNMGPTDYLILNGEDQVLARCDFKTMAQRIYFGLAGGTSTGAFMKDGQLLLKVSGIDEAVCSEYDVPIAGRHNLENALAASLMARLCGAKLPDIAAALKSFRGLPHRLEFVREIGGVKFYDDSKGTNVGAALKSLESFSCPVVLIAGGRDKGGDFSALAPFVREKVKVLIAVGEAAPKIALQLKGCCKIELASSFEEAVERSFGFASEGDVVLLSPACASFDMFANYEERGKRFKQIVMGFN